MTDVRTQVGKHLINKELKKLARLNPVIELPTGPTIGNRSKVNWNQAVQDYKTYHPSRPTSRASATSPADSFIVSGSDAVAIIGAGVAGLRTAMMLEAMGIRYQIFEASERIGGRIFTYRFPNKHGALQYDYYDVGAMRFPKNAANKTTFDLFNELGIQEQNNELIPYVMSTSSDIRYYNGIKTTAEVARTAGDHFEEGKEKDGIVTNEYVNMKYTPSNGKNVYGATACKSAAFEPYRIALVNDVKTGWELLMQHDWASTRSFLRQVSGYPWGTVQWMESRNSGTGGYDRAFSEAILDSLEFDYPTKPGDPPIEWWCIEGGSEVFTQRMVDKLNTKPVTNHRVSAISFEENLMKVTVNGPSNTESFKYQHVVSTVPFSALRAINMDGMINFFSYKQREAIRSINYGPAVKIAIKFKTRWWIDPNEGMSHYGGASMTDRPSRVVVYPSYGLKDNPFGPGVLMVSYNWHQDATRFGALITSSNWAGQAEPSNVGHTRSEKVLLEQLYDDLAALHGNSAQWLKEQTLDYHAFDWYHNEFTMGAFAHFAPGQFDNFFADITMPAALGQFHFAGEVASTHHAWVAGALESAWRAVYEILEKDYSEDKILAFKKKYGNHPIFGKDEKAAGQAQFLRGMISEQLEEVPWL